MTELKDYYNIDDFIWEKDFTRKSELSDLLSEKDFSWNLILKNKVEHYPHIRQPPSHITVQGKFEERSFFFYSNALAQRMSIYMQNNRKWGDRLNRLYFKWD